MHVIQQKLLRLVDSYNIAETPLRDIAKTIGEQHPQIIKHHLEQLHKKGLIVWDKEKKLISRCSESVQTNFDFIIIPILGAASCGPASLYADSNVEGHIKVSVSLLGANRDLFAIKAIGASMNLADIDGKNIENGDFVIVNPNDKDYRTNDYVLAIIDDRANVKRLSINKSARQITLLSESTYNYPPIIIDVEDTQRFLINGKVIQVIKGVS